MSWSVSDAQHLKAEFVLIATDPNANMSEACRQYKISRRTGYKWLKRYRATGYDGLLERSRRPHASPLRISGDLVLEIVRLRKKHRYWGPKKLRRKLLNNGCSLDSLPSTATVARVIRHAGLNEPNGRGRPRQWPAEGTQGPLSKPEGPNDVWTVDFKGWWRTEDGQRCEPLTIRDLFSRYILCLKPMERRKVEDVRQVFNEVFERYGLPAVIRSDNGSPFASITGPHGLTRLSAWWKLLNIKLERIEPGKPQQNGSHERMHRDVATEIQGQPSATLAEETKRLETWRVEYNLQRPHEALALKTPGEVYHCSARKLKDVRTYVYPVGYVLRRVARDGCILINNRTVYLSEALGRTEAGLERLSETTWQVWFCDLAICQIILDEGVPHRVLTPTLTQPAPSCYPCPDNKLLPMSCS
jgi:transposase InsO family protein